MSNEAINWAFAADISRSADKLVLLALANAANEYWACFPGKEEIAAKASCAPSSIVHCTRRLEAAGLLARIPFKALAGQDQKIGYVLAGGGRIHGLDDEFLALAFAARKLPGRPLPDKPKHWSGQRRDDAVSVEFEQGDQMVTLAGQGDYLVTPRGDQLVTPRTLSRTLLRLKTPMPLPQHLSRSMRSHRACRATTLTHRRPTPRRRREMNPPRSHRRRRRSPAASASTRDSTNTSPHSALPSSMRSFKNSTTAVETASSTGPPSAPVRNSVSTGPPTRATTPAANMRASSSAKHS